jgi:hypothetical protein
VTIDELERWKTEQIGAAVARGINPIDAAKSMADFLFSVPSNTDPIGYVRPVVTLIQDVSSQALRDDANGDWYARVASRFARLLDAREIE